RLALLGSRAPLGHQGAGAHHLLVLGRARPLGPLGPDRAARLLGAGPRSAGAFSARRGSARAALNASGSSSSGACPLSSRTVSLAPSMLFFSPSAAARGVSAS